MNKNYLVGIFIPTMNRADFVIRQLFYYANVQCPHTIYIGDSSTPQESQKIKNAIKELDGKLNVIFQDHQNLNMAESTVKLIKAIQEKYTCYIGDDDFQIPSSLTKCAEFLENNPDYSSARGYAISFRLINNGVYGEMKRLADYPGKQIELRTAAERSVDFMSNYYVPIFSVHKTELMRECWSETTRMKNWEFSAEILPCMMSLIWGKSKILDCLGFVRQVHNVQHKSPNVFNWIIGEDWYSSYKIFESIVSENISKKDDIPLENAIEVTKQALWAYLQKHLAKEYDDYGSISKNKNSYEKTISSTRSRIAQALPVLKQIYRMQIKPRLTGKREMNFEVLQPQSKYYKDFKPVQNSFTGKLLL